MPIGLTFADSSVMLLWARPGKDFKIWSRAFRRFVNLNAHQQADQTTWWTLKQEHSFVLGVFRSLLNPVRLNREAIDTEESGATDGKTVEGWLYKTIPRLPVDEEGTASLKGLKVYCVLDLTKLQLVLHSKTDGKVGEKFDLNGRLCAIDTSLVGKLD